MSLSYTQTHVHEPISSFLQLRGRQRAAGYAQKQQLLSPGSRARWPSSLQTSAPPSLTCSEETVTPPESSLHWRKQEKSCAAVTAGGNSPAGAAGPSRGSQLARGRERRWMVALTPLSHRRTQPWQRGQSTCHPCCNPASWPVF